MSGPSRKPAFWYCYKVDLAVCTPSSLNERWRLQHGHTALAGLFYVHECGLRPGSRRVRRHDQEPWWRGPGGGCSLVGTHESERDRALLAFFIAHLDSFEKVTFGPLGVSPNAPGGTRVLFARGVGVAAGGEAA